MKDCIPSYCGREDINDRKPGYMEARFESSQRIKDVINGLYDFSWDLRFGVSTRGIHPSGTPSHFNDNVECSPTPYRILNRIFSSVRFNGNDVFVDYGCGKGRVVCFAAQFPFRKVYGVEISTHWASIASNNVSKLRRKNAKPEVVNASVLDFDCHECTVFYLFNPFGERTFQAMLSGIYESLTRYPRKIKIIYYNFCCKVLLDKSDWLEEREILYISRSGKPMVLLYENIM